MLIMFKKHKLTIIGLIIGTIAGFLYYHFIGCVSGKCFITSNQTITIFYGALLGTLFLNLFKKQENKSDN